MARGPLLAIQGLYEYLRHGISGLLNNRMPPEIMQQIRGKGYELTGNQHFMELYPASVAQDFKHGWKFHLSINPDDTGRALDIVFDELSRQGHNAPFKVVNDKKNREFGDPHSDGAGKNITIYSDDNHERLMKIMQSIEDRLQQERIMPGPQVKSDRPVPGSAYASYRNDEVNGHYSFGKNSYNDGGHDDPYKGMLFVTETNKGPMVRTDRMPPHEAESLARLLTLRGITYTQRPSGANYGRPVINIEPGNRAEFEQVRRDLAAYHRRAVPQKDATNIADSHMAAGAAKPETSQGGIKPLQAIFQAVTQGLFSKEPQAGNSKPVPDISAAASAPLLPDTAGAPASPRKNFSGTGGLFP